MTAYNRLATILGVSVFSAILFIQFPASAHGGDAASEAATAAQHANLAAQADSLDGVHAHLQHAINCLVGPDGEEFDAEQINPCDGMGDGAIADAADDEMAERLEEALEHALEGLDADDLDAARAHAKAAADLLKKKN
ncbi:MAG: hypothetical protein D6807_08840 [Alphaproteobacteria bacterium]|nr:MAG: hypothetical protein D6807_08840 [Alphaproteobacteria bacterium]